MLVNRDVAQLGSALPWGGRGRQFKSGRSDQIVYKGYENSLFLLFLYEYLPKRVIIFPIKEDKHYEIHIS